MAATLEVLADVGYDRLTMDKVAAVAHASKATLYRRWVSKSRLVMDAISCAKHPVDHLPDTGNLRDDLVAHFSHGNLTDPQAVSLMAAVLSAMARDDEFATAFRAEFLEPKLAASRLLFDRARSRGEIRADANTELIGQAIPAMVMHRHFVLGEAPTLDLVTEVIDQLILPALAGVTTPLSKGK